MKQVLLDSIRNHLLIQTIKTHLHAPVSVENATSEFTKDSTSMTSGMDLDVVSLQVETFILACGAME